MRVLLPLLIFILFNLAAAQEATVISDNANLRGTPNSAGKVVDVLPQNTLLQVFKDQAPWYLVQAPEYVGWIHGNTIRFSDAGRAKPSIRSSYDVIPDRTDKPQERRYFTGPRGGCYYLNSSGNKSYVDRSLCGEESALPSTSSGSKGYIRGPKGGCYYINSRGKKTYVSRSKCN